MTACAHCGYGYEAVYDGAINHVCMHAVTQWMALAQDTPPGVLLDLQGTPAASSRILW